MSIGLSVWAKHTALRWRYRRSIQSHFARRLPKIQSDFDAAHPGYVLLVGDSHAELIGRHRIGRFDVVNAGIGGSSTRDCARRLPQFRVPVQAAVAIFCTGSNDIMAGASPLSDRTATGFEAAAEQVLRWLQAHAGQVVVTAVPPIQELRHAPRETAAIKHYSDRLDRLARDNGCHFFDLYADLRDGTSGLARPGTIADGVHFVDYDALAEKIASLIDDLCEDPNDC